MRRLFAALAFFALLAVGCSSGSKLAERPTGLPERFPDHSLSEIRALILQPTDTLRAFEAAAQLSLESPQRSGNFGATVRARRGDSLYLGVSSFGIEGARALVTPDSFFVYNRLGNDVTFGALADAGGQLPAPLVTGDVFENLLGILAPESGTDWTVAADSNRYVLEAPSGRRTYTIDPALWRVVRYTERAPDGALVEERVFSDFDRIGGFFLPRRVLLRRPADDAFASLYYRELTLNPPGLSFDLQVRRSARRVPASR